MKSSLPTGQAGMTELHTGQAIPTYSAGQVITAEKKL